MTTVAIIDTIGLTYDGTTLQKHGLGGSESAVILMAKELQAIGLSVTVFNNCIDARSSPGTYDGVVYRDLTELDRDNRGQFDVVISSRTVIPFLPKELWNQFPDLHPQRFERIAAAAKHKVVWMHDTFLRGDHLLEDLIVHGYVDEIFTLSDWHTSYVMNCDHGKRRNFEVLKDHVFMTRNGVVKYHEEVDVKAKDPFLYVYNASVTKGMMPLVQIIWPEIKKAIPQAKLKVIGGYYRFRENAAPDEQEKTWRQLVADPKYAAMDVEFTGIITQRDIADILTKSSFFLYPGAFPETFGISTLESLTYNTPLIATRFGALEETAISQACYFIDYAIEPNGLFPNINTEQQQKKFIEAVIAAHNNRYLHQQKMYACNAVKDICTWDTVALQWKQHIFKKLGQYLSVNQYRQAAKINARVHSVFGRRFSNKEEVYIPRNPQQRITAVMPFYNAEPYIEKAVASIISQDYDNYQCVLIDDCSTDNALQRAEALVKSAGLSDKFKLVRNDQNMGAVFNQIAAITQFAGPDDIIMLVDGDDALVNDNQLFQFYNNLYDGTTDFAYGSCWSIVDNIPLIAQPYPLEVRKQRGYRDYLFNWNMPYTHLRTFRASLLNGVEMAAFQDDQGKWFKAGGDGAVFYTAIENADPAKVKVVSDVVYLYNDKSPINDYKVNGDEQTKNAQLILSRKYKHKFSVVVPTMWRAQNIFERALASYIDNPLVSEVIIINNDVENTPDWDILNDPKVRMFNQKENIKVNPAWNLGVNQARNDRVCIANDDIWVDPDVFGKMSPRIVPGGPVHGLISGEAHFNQPQSTDYSINFIEWKPGDIIHCFGQFMFIHKSDWVPIIPELEIYFGDDFIFHCSIQRGALPVMIYNIKFESPMAQTTSDKSLTDGYHDRELPHYQAWAAKHPLTILEKKEDSVNLENEYQLACAIQSDIHKHLPTLRRYADQCADVTEFGVRSGMSTRAFLASKTPKIRSYDLYIDPVVLSLFKSAHLQGKDVSYQAADTLRLDIEQTDMLFIDTDHTYIQLSQELERHHSKVNKYIVFHDTVSFGLHPDNPNVGLIPAIMEFMQRHPEWVVDYFTTENNGLMVLKRSNKASPVPETPAGPVKNILIAIPTNKYIEPDTMKAIYDLEVPPGYKTHFQFFYGYQVDQIRNLIADWAKHYDYLFSVDSDISFAPDTLKKLLSHDKDIVTGLYIQRKPGQHIVEVFGPNGNIPYDELKGKGLVPVGGCGFGCVLIKGDVFRTMEYPHFVYKSALNHADTLSEDVYFCMKAREKGFQVFADTSILCSHHGSTVFKVEEPPILKNKESAETTRLRELSQMDLLPKAHFEYLQTMSNRGTSPKVIYDIGACVLHWTNKAKQVWPDAKYIAFEAMAEAKPIFEQAGVDYHIGLLSSQTGKDIKFYQNTEHPGGNSYYRENSELSPAADVLFDESHAKVLKSARLDDVVASRGFPYPDLIKMDVQGAELDVLKGAQRCLAHAKDVILEIQKVEYNKGAPLEDEVIKYVLQQGFILRTGPFCDNGPDGDYHFTRG